VWGGGKGFRKNRNLKNCSHRTREYRFVQSFGLKTNVRIFVINLDLNEDNLFFCLDTGCRFLLFSLLILKAEPLVTKAM